MTTYQLPDGPARFYGQISLEVTDAGVTPWRLPHQIKHLFHDGFRNTAACAAGVRLSLISNTSSLAVTYQTTGPETQVRFDLLVDGQRHDRLKGKGPGTAEFTGIPAGSHLLELYLPHHAGAITLGELTLDDAATSSPFIDTRPRWTVYGSSITQSGDSAGPSETWPAIVANKHGLNLTCLGVSGNCHMEPMVARIIRDHPADYISCCLGINVYGQPSLSKRTFREAVIGLIMLAREKHPHVPFVAVSPISSPPRDHTPNPLDATLQDYRDMVRDAVHQVLRCGDSMLFYQDGMELFPPELAERHMPDKLHPDHEGYLALAEQYSKHVIPKFGLAGEPAGT